MTEDEFKNLKRGETVRHKLFRRSIHVVTGNYGGRVTAVSTVDLTNPSEWEIVKNE